MALTPRTLVPAAWRDMHLFNYHRNVYLMLLFTFGKGLQLSIAALTTNLYVLSLGYKPEFIGLVAAMPAVGAFVAAVPTGLLADRWGRRPLLIVSGLLNPLALAAIALSTSAPALLIASLCNGILSGGYWVTNLPVLTESTSDDQRVGVLALNSFLLLGVGAAGSLIGGFVPEVAAALLHMSANDVVPLRWGVLAAAIVVFLPALPLFWLTDTQGRSTPAPQPGPLAPLESTEEQERLAVGAALAEQRAEPVDPVGRLAVAILFVKLLIPDVLFTTGSGAVVGLMQVYLHLRFGVNPGTLGVLFTAAGLVGGATSLLSPRLVRRWGALPVAVAMQYLTVPAMLTTGFAPAFTLAAGGEFARNVFRGFFDPVYATFTMGSVSRRLRATLSGFYSTTWSIGFTIGPAIAGFLQQHISLSSSFILGALCVSTSATLLTVFFGRARPRGKTAA
jgi:MFS family permease